MHTLSSVNTLTSYYLYMPQVVYIYKTYDWNFSYKPNAFPGFDFDLDEVWAPLNPHLKHVTKGSPSKDEICHCLVLIFLLDSPAGRSRKQGYNLWSCLYLWYQDKDLSNISIVYIFESPLVPKPAFEKGLWRNDTNNQISFKRWQNWWKLNLKCSNRFDF